VDCNKGPDSDKPAFAALVRELRQAFNPKGLLLSAAVSPSKTVIDAGQCDNMTTWPHYHIYYLYR
jgi:chitinase